MQKHVPRYSLMIGMMGVTNRNAMVQRKLQREMLTSKSVSSLLSIRSNLRSYSFLLKIYVFWGYFIETDNSLVWVGETVVSSSELLHLGLHFLLWLRERCLGSKLNKQLPSPLEQPLHACQGGTPLPATTFGNICRYEGVSSITLAL